MREGWKSVELGSVLNKIVGGGTPSKRRPDYWNGNIPWCSVKDMSYDKFQLSETKDTITELGLNKSSSKLIKAGTVITSTRMGLGKAFISHTDMAINQDLKALIPNNKIDNKFLLWTIISHRSILLNKGTGSTVKGIRLETLRALKINVPPLPTQRKIANILSGYDDLIENNLQRIKLLEEQAQLTYEEWFVRMKFPGHETAVFDPSASSGQVEETRLPEGWGKTKIGEACKVTGGGTPSKAKKGYWEKGNIAWYTPTDLSKSNSLVQLRSSLNINEIGLKKSSAKLLKPNSFMMTSRATIGLFGITQNPFTTNQGFINITPARETEKEFLLYSFKNKIPLFENYATGTTFLEISRGNLKSIKLNWPSESLINQYHKLVYPMHKTLFNLTNQNQLLKEARDLLLPRLMMGLVGVDELLDGNKNYEMEEVELRKVAEEGSNYKKDNQ